MRRSREALAVDDFPARLDELTAYLADDGPPRLGVTGTIRAIPTNVPPPETWLLGSGDTGGLPLAAERGLGFAFAQHINAPDAVHALRRYRETFVPSPHRREPWAILTVAVVCAETDALAEELALSGELAMVRFREGIRDLPLPSVEEARAHVYDAEENALRPTGWEGHVVGGVARVRQKLNALIAASKADEVMVLTHVHSHEARKRSYALVAEALGTKAG